MLKRNCRKFSTYGNTTFGHVRLQKSYIDWLDREKSWKALVGLGPFTQSILPCSSHHTTLLVVLLHLSVASLYCLSPLSPSPSFPPCTLVSPPIPVVRVGCAWWSGCFAGWSSPVLCSSGDALDCWSVCWGSERILAFGAADEFSEGSGRLEAGFGVSISFAWLGVVVNARI
jgi:hypothetical protein